MNPARIILSASRRTDIPAFYMGWFMDGLNAGRFERVNPYNRQSSLLAVSPETVHSIVFWSKNYGPFLDDRHGEAVVRMGYPLFFNFTVNSEDRLLEPHVPPLAERLGQMARLADTFGAAAVQWRFDPVVRYKTLDGRVRHNLGDFTRIADVAGKIGVTRCITSFADLYAKVVRRAEGKPGFSFLDPLLEDKVRVLEWMAEITGGRGISLFLCCEPDVLGALPPGSPVRPSACVPGDLLADLFGGGISLKKDGGQRVKAGCRCTASVDVGVYHRQPCFHDCLYCYANPGPPPSKRHAKTRACCREGAPS